MRHTVLVASLIVAVTTVHGYKHYQTKIPNGESVPHPCKPNYMWKGVGHTNAAGGGERNQFGKDFKKAGKTWTQALCQKDSDSDGKTNGEELGDPNCVWTEGGGAPEITVGLSHPEYIDDVLPINNPNFKDHLHEINPHEQQIRFELGEEQLAVYDKRDEFSFHITNFLSSNIPSSPAYGVFVSQLIRYARVCSKYEDFIVRARRLASICDPFDSEQCRGRNTWVDCSSQEFKCDALERENPKDLMNVTLRFKPTQVPPKETNYFCMTFDLNLKEEYHMIATEPVIDNEYVMHHMVLFGCTGSDAPDLDVPTSCNIMGVPGCFHIIGLWAVGTFGECFHEQAGFLLGQGSGFKKVVMQFHWNNPQLKADYVDSSGMVLHLTKSKRTHNAGVLQVGQYYIQLSPGQEKIVVEGRCTPDMSRFRLKGPIHFTTGINHMHYLGRAMNMEHFRNGVKLRDLTMDEVYSYDSPVFHNYAESVRFEPGDEIKTSCHFKTTERSKTVFQGDGTNDEMCFGFLTYYPTENMINPYCIQWRGLDYSSFYYQETINGCSWKDFLNTSIPTTEALHTRVLSHCSKLGLCLKECVSVIKEAKKHPCLQGDMHEYFRHLAREDGAKNAPLARLFSALDSCYTEMAVESCPKPLTDPTSTSSTVQFSVFWIGAASVLRHIMK